MKAILYSQVSYTTSGSFQGRPEIESYQYWVNICEEDIGITWLYTRKQNKEAHHFIDIISFHIEYNFSKEKRILRQLESLEIPESIVNLIKKLPESEDSLVHALRENNIYPLIIPDKLEVKFLVSTN